LTRNHERVNWDEAVRVLGGTPAPTDLEERYAEPHRKYHDLTHVRQVVRDAVALTEGRDRAVVALAAWAHDVVYDGRPGDDERASAAWARQHLTAVRLAEADVDRVEGLVLATIGHTAPPEDRVAQALLDADLGILAAAPAVYERYRLAVRAEYAHVTDDAWRTGRAAVLRSLLAKDPLYLLATHWESAARRNLAAELAGLADLER
jgi:predicted metal-dependent HD superfamily phosphohydrolase